MKKIKTVYLTLSGEMIHHGHINLIQRAQKFGTLIIGLLTDQAIMKNKSLPLLNWDQRKKILQNINGVKKVIPQNEWDDAINITKIKPDYVGAHHNLALAFKELGSFNESIKSCSVSLFPSSFQTW